MMLTDPAFRGKLLKKLITINGRYYTVKKVTRKKVIVARGGFLHVWRVKLFAYRVIDCKDYNTEIYNMMKEHHPEFLI